MVLQALGIILVLAVVMSVAAVGSSTSGRTEPYKCSDRINLQNNFSIAAARAGDGKSVPHHPQSFRCSGGFPFLCDF